MLLALARMRPKHQSELCSWTALGSNLQKKPSEPHPLTCSSTVPPQARPALNHAAVPWIYHMLAMRPGPPGILTVGKPKRLKRLREGKKPTQPEQKKPISPHPPDTAPAQFSYVILKPHTPPVADLRRHLCKALREGLQVRHQRH